MSQKILFVTGASSDIGCALIRQQAVGFDKILCHYGKSQSKIDALQKEFGERIIPFKADFANPEEVEDLVSVLKEQGLMPTHFVHLPAIPNENKKYAKTDWAEYETQLTVQVHSAHILCKTILPVMAKQRYGKVIFMLTENVARAMPGKFAVPYTVAKYALLGLMKCLASEYADKGITVNGVSPSMVETSFVAGLPELSRQLNAANNPMKRNLTVEDVISTLAFLLSDGSNMITGQNIAIMGGN